MTKPVVCIGAALIDDSFYCTHEPLLSTSNPSTLQRSAGGVARNIAHVLAQLGNPVELITHFGNDPDGTWLMEKCLSANIGLSHSRKNDLPTGHFAAIIAPGGELFAGASASNLEDEITTGYLSEKSGMLQSASLILIDCNLCLASIDWLLAFCRTNAIPVIIEPVSIVKAARLKKLNLEDVLLLTPNLAELAVLSDKPMNEEIKSSVDSIIQKGVQKLWLRKGKEGSELFTKDGNIKRPAPDVEVSDTTGAGDAALAGWIHAWLRNKNESECLHYGHVLAEIILKKRGANDMEINSAIVERQVKYQLDR